MFCFKVFLLSLKLCISDFVSALKRRKNWPETVILKNTGKIDIFIFAWLRDGLFWRKTSFKGAPSRFWRGQGCLPFSLKKPSKINILVFGAHFTSRFSLRFSYKTWKQNHWFFMFLVKKKNFSMVSEVVLAWSSKS